MVEKSNPMKDIVSEFLAFLKFKVDNDILTMEEIASILKTIESETPAYISGDSARALADVICRMGCGNCR